MSGNDVFARKKALKERTFGRDFLCLKRVLFAFSLYQFGALGTLYKTVWRNCEILVFSSLRTRGQKVSSDRAPPLPLVKSTESGSQSLVPFFFVFYARTINHLHKTENAGYGKLPNPMLAILAFSRPFFSLFLCRVGNSSQAQITLKPSKGRGSKE